jgi:Spy/CpxP family protein refolding chaperone
MTKMLMRAVAAGRLMAAGAAAGLLLAASPVLAQTPGAGGVGQMEGRMGGRMFQSLSEEGRATMFEAMRASNRQSERAEIKAARDRMLTVLEAEKLDTPALKRAMDDERKIAASSHEARQTAMLAAFTKLSVADRKAFVTEAREMREKMQARMGGKRMRDRREGGAL